MIADKLPSVLYQPNGNSISMERALKQIRMLLDEYTDDQGIHEDVIMASIDDVDTMLANLDRS